MKLRFSFPPLSPDLGKLLVPLLFCSMVLAVGAVFFLWQRYQFIALGFEVSVLRKQNQKIFRELEPLEVEVAYLSRLERLEKLAREDWGMRLPAPNRVIVLEKHVPPAD